MVEMENVLNGEDLASKVWSIVEKVWSMFFFLLENVGENNIKY